MNGTRKSDTQQGFRAWINSQIKVVSFHPVENWQTIRFSSRELLLCEIMSMVNLGYRIQ